MQKWFRLVDHVTSMTRIVIIRHNNEEKIINIEDKMGSDTMEGGY